LNWKLVIIILIQQIHNMINAIKIKINLQPINTDNYYIKMCNFIHDSMESQVIGTPHPQGTCHAGKSRLHDVKPMSQSVFAVSLAR
jgi:hypothetical protein